jgi:hypothetical protein
MTKIDEEMKTEFGEFLDEYLTRYNLSAYHSPTARKELFDICRDKCFWRPEFIGIDAEAWGIWSGEIQDEEDELGQIFDTKYAEMNGVWLNRLHNDGPLTIKEVS